jgi:hypothetical protein
VVIERISASAGATLVFVVCDARWSHATNDKGYQRRGINGTIDWVPTTHVASANDIDDGFM